MQLTFTTQTASFAVDEPTRTGRGLALPFGVASSPSASDGHRYRFTGPPTNADELVDLVREHDDDALIGRLSAPWDTEETGLTASARFFDTGPGRDAFVEAKEGARAGFSVKALVNAFTEAADGVREVTDYAIAHLGLVRRPAFAGAGIQFAATAEITPTKENHRMDTIDVAALAAQVIETPTIASLAEKVNNLPSVAELAEQVANQLNLEQAPAHPLAAFATAEDFYAAFQAAHEAKDTDKVDTLQAAFAVPDQTTGDNPGLMVPGWRTDIKKRIDRRTPAVRAFGTAGLPPHGMDVSWPYLDPALDIDAIVRQQMAEKEELQGVKIKILKDTEAIKTAGAVSDISYQLLMRSTPSYLAAHNEILLAAWARYMEAKFTDQLVAKGTAAGDLAADTVANFRAQLFEVSADVEDATGSPADVVLVASDVWATLGASDDLYNPRYGTQNVAGTASAATLKVNINGLDIVRAPFLADGTAIVASSDAAKASNSGARIATAEDVRKLGRDVAVWGMYTDGEIYFPAGIRVLTTTAAG